MWDSTQCLPSYLGFAIDSCMVLNQEVCHFCIAIVTGHMYRCVTHLSGKQRKAMGGLMIHKIIYQHLHCADCRIHFGKYNF